MLDAVDWTALYLFYEEDILYEEDIAGTGKRHVNVDQGTVPNQNGTWWFARTSWCPGKQVDPWVWDITDQVTPGQSATLSYSTNYGMPLTGGSIFLRTWVTFWR